jgi:hypothetical protein
MVAVAARYGENEFGAQYLLPVSVDGLIVVASICLVELTGRIQQPPILRVVRGELPATPATPPTVSVTTTVEPAKTSPTVISNDGCPDGQATPRPRAKRVKPRSLTAEQRVTAAHRKEPGASHERIGELAEVSLSTVKRHRPTGSPSVDLAAETINATGPRPKATA